jgi:hypothetical protein
VLMRTTRHAWEKTGNLLLYPRDLNEYMPENQRSFPLVALQSGRVTSFYADNLPDGLTETEVERHLRESSADARLLVVANALFASDFYVGYTNAVENQHFILNALDQMALDSDLIHVRSRVRGDPPLREDRVSSARIPVILVNMLLAPLLLLAIGLFFEIRRRRKEAQG